MSSTPLKNAKRFSKEQLIKLAGQERFELGQAVLDSVALEIQRLSEFKFQSHLMGFQVTIEAHDKHVQGYCDCPVSDGFDFCEHCVALCLQINKQEQQIRSLAKGPDKSKVLAYLLNLEKAELAKQCLALITADNSQFERYLLKAMLHQTPLDYSQLKTQITQLTRKPDHLFSQRQVKAFFANLERFLEELAAPDAPIFDHEKILRLYDYLIQRLNLLLEQFDDSNDQRARTVSLLQSLYQKSFAEKQGRDETLAKQLFGIWLIDRFDILGAGFTSVLSATGRLKFNSIVNELFTTHLNNPNLNKLNRWQEAKLARYLFEEAIQSHDEDQAKKFRPYFSKD